MTEATPEKPRRSGLFIGFGALVVVVLVALAVYLSARDDGDSAKPAATSTRATAPTTLPVDASTAVWPFASSTTRYSDPVSAARGFAAEYVGFTNPVVGEFRPGDTRSGEVPVQSTSTGPITTVLVRQLGDSWWVLGASTPNIRLNSPAAMTAISSPVRLQGTSTAFEATVNTEVRSDDSTQPIGTGIVMGGANGELGPFDDTLAFTRPSTASGALMLLTRSAADGSASEATVVRVTFA